MEEVRGTNSWREELASLMDDPGVRFAADPMSFSSTTSFEVGRSVYSPSESASFDSAEKEESLKEQAMGFLMAWCEILMELGRGCRDILRQNLFNEDSYVVRNLAGPCAKVSKRLRFLNDFLPEDRDPFQAWSVVFFVFVIALAGFLIQFHLFYFILILLSVAYFFMLYMNVD